MTSPVKTTLLGLAFAASLLSSASADTSSSTPIIGYYKFTVPAGDSAWTCGLVTKTLFQGQAASFQNNTPSAGKCTITFSGSVGSANAFNTSTNPASSSHYVEVLDTGTQQGRVLDIISNTANAIVVNGVLPAAPTQPQVGVHKHATLSTIFPTGGGTDPDHGKGLVRELDYITLYFSNGSLEQYQFNPNNTWSTTGGTPANDVVIYPGQGFQVTSSASTELLIGGGDVSYVKNTPTQIPLYVTGVNLVGLLDPVVAAVPGIPTLPAIEKSTLQQYSFQSIPGVTGELDLFTVFSIDGAFGQTPYLVNANLTGVEDTGGTAANNVPLPNGTAVYVIPSDDLTWTAPVLHPH